MVGSRVGVAFRIKRRLINSKAAAVTNPNQLCATELDSHTLMYLYLAVAKSTRSLFLEEAAALYRI